MKFQSQNPNAPRKLHLKVRLKIEQIARFRCAGVTDVKIRQILGLSVFGFVRITRLREYAECEASILSGTLSTLDMILGSKAEAMKTYFASAVPAAMRALVETVLQKTDLKARLEASKEILNRDPKRTFVEAKDAARSAGDAQLLPESLIDDLGKRATQVTVEAEKAAMGPSGKPN